MSEHRWGWHGRDDWRDDHDHEWRRHRRHDSDCNDHEHRRDCDR